VELRIISARFKRISLSKSEKLCPIINAGYISSVILLVYMQI
jgi:hypothetical protein